LLLRETALKFVCKSCCERGKLCFPLIHCTMSSPGAGKGLSGSGAGLVSQSQQPSRISRQRTDQYWSKTSPRRGSFWGMYDGDSMKRQQVTIAQRNARNAEFEDLEDAPEPRRGGPAATANTPRGGSPRSSSARRGGPPAPGSSTPAKGAKIRRAGGGARAEQGSYSRQAAPASPEQQASEAGIAAGDAASQAGSVEAAPAPLPLPPKPSNAPDELELKMTRELKELKAELDALERTLAVRAQHCCNATCNSTGSAQLGLPHTLLAFFTDFKTH